MPLRRCVWLAALLLPAFAVQAQQGGGTTGAAPARVLRIDRFNRLTPLPADASAYVYVLDLVVESEAVKN
jgi:hypothetical protein